MLAGRGAVAAWEGAEQRRHRKGRRGSWLWRGGGSGLGRGGRGLVGREVGMGGVGEIQTVVWRWEGRGGDARRGWDGSRGGRRRGVRGARRGGRWWRSWAAWWEVGDERKIAEGIGR